MVKITNWKAKFSNNRHAKTIGRRYKNKRQMITFGLLLPVNFRNLCMYIVYPITVNIYLLEFARP